ncbi:MAG: hypothetical protein LBJ00_14155 [Planctomycetaceae bacterium]|nr:hypothetical protein [Planctomycetaceae bacterium]
MSIYRKITSVVVFNSVVLAYSAEVKVGWYKKRIEFDEPATVYHRTNEKPCERLLKFQKLR